MSGAPLKAPPNHSHLKAISPGHHMKSEVAPTMVRGTLHARVITRRHPRRADKEGKAREGSVDTGGRPRAYHQACCMRCLSLSLSLSLARALPLFLSLQKRDTEGPTPCRLAIDGNLITVAEGNCESACARLAPPTTDGGAVAKGKNAGYLPWASRSE